MPSGAAIEMREVELETTRTSRSYRARLQCSLALFIEFLALCNVGATAWWRCEAATNQLLCEFIEHSRAIGRPIAYARHAILGVQTCHKHLRGHLYRAWQCLKSWQQTIPLNSRPPITVDLVRAIFAMSIAEALAASSGALEMVSFAVLVRVGFECLLRSGEIVKLLVGDIRLPQSRYEPRVAVVTLRDPKNRAAMGRFQFAMIRDTALVDWLIWITAGLGPHVRLWPGSAAKFGKTFKRIQARLGLERLGLTPGSLRPGGATKAFLEGMPIASLKYLGRWKVESSLEVYVQEAMAHLKTCTLSDNEHESLQALVQAADQQWSGPPTLPWTTLFHRAAQWRGLRLKAHTTAPSRN